jgi:hypothetical protein
MPHGIVFEFDRGNDDDSGKTMGWLDVFLDTMASATGVLANGSEAKMRFVSRTVPTSRMAIRLRADRRCGLATR